MRVLNGSWGRDVAGVAYQLERAFGKTDVHYDSVATHTPWLAYPTRRLPLGDDLLDLWRRADVVHVNNDADELRRQLHAPRRPRVVMHHGSALRSEPATHLAALRGARTAGVVTTLDLWLLAPEELTWCPVPYDGEWLKSFRTTLGGGALRIAHAPTTRGIKSTEPFLKAVERLGRILPVELILVERTPWLDCLKLKGRADVYFDQVKLGYGCNAVEAWGMGIPVIAGGADETLAEMERRFGALPFRLADEGSIFEALLSMCDEQNRADYAARGAEHFERFHCQRAVVDVMRPVYERIA